MNEQPLKSFRTIKKIFVAKFRKKPLLWGGGGGGGGGIEHFTFPLNITTLGNIDKVKT